MADKAKKPEPSFFDRVSRNFAVAQAKITGPVVQEPGTDTIHAQELLAVGVDRRPGRHTEPLTMSNIDPSIREKIEALRKKTYAPE